MRLQIPADLAIADPARAETVIRCVQEVITNSMRHAQDDLRIGNREIAAALAPREGTVKNHVTSIFSKLNVADRTMAVLRAIAAGLV